MTATREGNTINIANNLVDALVSPKSGYSVVLHDKPQYTFMVSSDCADTIDSAHNLVVAIARREGLKLKVTGATIQRF